MMSPLSGRLGMVDIFSSGFYFELQTQRPENYSIYLFGNLKSTSNSKYLRLKDMIATAHMSDLYLSE